MLLKSQMRKVQKLKLSLKIFLNIYIATIKIKLYGL